MHNEKVADEVAEVGEGAEEMWCLWTSFSTSIVIDVSLF